MTTKLANLARMTTATVGTGTITLGVAASGRLTFAQAGVVDGQTVTYSIIDGANSEIGRGVYTTAGLTLTRAVLKSTNANAAINLSGSAQVLVAAAAEDFTTVELLNSGLTILDTGADNTLTIKPSENLSANRILNLSVNDASRTITIAADATISGSPIIQGLQTINIPAAAMTPRQTNGAATGTIELATNKVMFRTLDFDATTSEFAQFAIRMPKSWNLGTVTFKPVWSHAATATNFGVVWELAALAISDNEAGDAAFGTGQTSTDTGGTTNNIYHGPVSSAITAAGTVAAEDLVIFQIARLPANASDTLAVDARLHGISVFYTVSAASDA